MSDTPETNAFYSAYGYRTDEDSKDFARRLERERDALREENRELREALNECREDSIELLCERDWWKNEPRGNHRQAYEQIQENIRRADELLKEQP